MIYIDKTTAINFRHSRVDNPDGVKAPNKRLSESKDSLMKSRRTECEILQILPDQEPLVMGYGESLCHPNDNFNKEFGRKNALARAISKMARQDRTVIWNAYFNR